MKEIARAIFFRSGTNANIDDEKLAAGCWSFAVYRSRPKKTELNLWY